MKNKLIVILDEDILNVPSHLVFDNEMDARDYFQSLDRVKCVNFNLDFNRIVIKLEFWSCGCNAYWAKHI